MSSGLLFKAIGNLLLWTSVHLSGPLDSMVLALARWALTRAGSTSLTMRANSAERLKVGGYAPGEKRGGK